MKPKIADIHRLLQNYLDGYEIVEQKISTLTAPGEHYGSIILAVNLKVRLTKNGTKEKIINLVAKCLPSNEMLRKVFDVNVTFKKEVLAYTVAIPALVEFQKEYGVSVDKYYDKLFPLCAAARVNIDEYVDEVDDNGVLLFENLLFRGFYTEDRLKGYDAEAAKVVVRDLARFHATPIAMKLLKPDAFDEKVKQCLVKNKGLEQVPKIAEVFHLSIMEGACECLELEPYLDKIQRICDDFILHTPVNTPPTEPWGTFSHMDFWTSNSMILKNLDGNYTESKILDLQLITYNSALKDLVFFLFTSVVNKDLDEHFDQFIQIYYNSFIDTVKDFGLDLNLFSWKNFQTELENVGRKEIYHIFVMLKPICTEKGVVKNTAQDFEDSDWTRKDLLGPNHRRKLRDTVLSLIKQNFM